MWLDALPIRNISMAKQEIYIKSAKRVWKSTEGRKQNMRKWEQQHDRRV